MKLRNLYQGKHEINIETKKCLIFDNSGIHQNLVVPQ